jgi:serine/threonine-protein kinase
VLGALLGKYRVLEQLGEGGMGVVYVGRHEQLGHRVVVKVLRPEMSRKTDMVQRFFNEAQAATSIRNPGIVQVFDFGTTPDGQAYFVMELLDGQSLGARLKQRRLDDAECCRLGRQVANVLQAAHAAGITHRDLKPDNLFLVPDPEVIGGERVKVLDFGIAKLSSDAHAGVHTRTDLVMGTPSYMSPEQCRGAGTVDPRSDIYSLGCILFKMACGRPPFVGEGAGEIIGAHLHVPPPHPQSFAPDLSSGLAELIMKMLAKQPDARPQTMTEVSGALGAILEVLGGPPARPSFPPAPSAGAAPDPRTSPPLPAHLPAAPPHLLSPVSLPEQRAMPSSTTLGGSAGMSIVSPRPGARRLPFVLGGLVIAGAAIAIAVVLATADPEPQQRQISYDDIAAAPQPATAPAPGAAAPTEPAAAAPTAGSGSAEEPLIEMEPMPATPAASELEAECRGYLAGRKWRELEQCADRLQPTDPARAEELRTRAADGTAAARIAGVEAALRDKNLKKAKAELDQVSRKAAGYWRIKRKYTEAEDAAIAALAVQLDRVKDRDCEEYNELLAAERKARPPRVAAEAARKTPCTKTK